jgi:hypothetical protein
MRDVWSRLESNLNKVKNAGERAVGEKLQPIFNGSSKTREQVVAEYRAEMRRREALRKRWPGW